MPHSLVPQVGRTVPEAFDLMRIVLQSPHVVTVRLRNVHPRSLSAQTTLLSHTCDAECGARLLGGGRHVAPDAGAAVHALLSLLFAGDPPCAGQPGVKRWVG